MSAEEFLRPIDGSSKSAYENFRSELARQIGLEEARVKIFSIMPMRNSALPAYIDVFFAVETPGPGVLQYGASRAPYISPVYLTAVIERNL